MTHITVIGGGIAGLAATETARNVAETVTLYDAGSYNADRSGAWGELVRDFRSLPVERSIEGVVRPVDHITVYTGTDSLSSCFELHAKDFMMIDRGILETAWANKLAADSAVSLQSELHISPGHFDEVVAESDLVIDASGPDPVSGARIDAIEAPRRVIRTVSASTTGDFSAYYPTPAAVVSRQTKMFISTKEPNRATYGVGWEEHRAPTEMIDRFYELCDLADVPRPDRNQIQTGTEPIVRSRSVRDCVQTYQHTPVRLVGDAAGLVDGMNRFGMNRAAASGQQAVQSWFGQSSYQSWLRTATRRIRYQSQLLRPIEGFVGDQRLTELLGRVADKHPVTRF